MTTTPCALTLFFSTQTQPDEIARVCATLTNSDCGKGVRLSAPMQNSIRPEQNQAIAITFKIEAETTSLTKQQEKGISNNFPKVVIAHQFHSKPEYAAA